MSLRTPLAAVSSVIILFLAVWAYGSYVASVARQEVVEHQIIAPESGDDCATFDEVASLDSVLDKLTMDQRRFLDGESPASAQRQWMADLTPQLDAFLASHRCALAGDSPSRKRRWAMVSLSSTLSSDATSSKVAQSSPLSGATIWCSTTS